MEFAQMRNRVLAGATMVLLLAGAISLVSHTHVRGFHPLLTQAAEDGGPCSLCLLLAVGMTAAPLAVAPPLQTVTSLGAAPPELPGTTPFTLSPFIRPPPAA
jgi:hypothetical protein